MAGMRWRAPTALTLLAVFALCFSLQQTPPLAAKDKARSNSAAATSDDASSAQPASADSDAANGKASKKKPKAVTEKKKPQKNRGKSGSDDSADSGSPAGISSGSGVPATTVGGQSNEPAGNSPTAKPNVAQARKPGQEIRAGGAAGTKAASGNRGKPTRGVGGQGQQAAQAQLDANHPLVKKVIDVQNRNTANLMAQKGIIGTGTGLDDDGNVVIRVYTTGADSPKIPAQLENVTVQEVLTGPLFPYQFGANPLFEQRLPRPVPIGVTAIWDPGPNGLICAAATYGCRLVDSNGNIYGLSNNHVWADENNNPLGTPAVQPSPLDNSCITGITADQIGTLAAFVPLIFDGTTPNPCDAAIIISNAQLLNTSTLSDGYGVPTSTNAAPFLGQLVQKYGRTTGYTRGKVVGINVTAIIGYNNGPCLFNDFIDIFPVAPFANFGNPGDSGSLVVDMGRNPVGIVVGGGGGDAFHSPIGVVLKQLELQLASQPGTPAGTTLKVDSSPAALIGKEGRSDANAP